jgi:hypothetical protein
MKIIVAILILVSVKLGLYAQTKFTTITGETVGRKSTYAYLSAKNEIYSSKIVGNRFEFILPKVDGFVLGTLLFWSDSLSNEKAHQMFKNRDNDYRSMVIEDAHIIAPTVTKEAIVKGGRYNLELDEMFQSLEAKTYPTFFDKHPDSPVSLILLRVLISMAKIRAYFNGELKLKAYYDKLSDSLKKSEKGKELWKMIAPMYN